MSAVWLRSTLRNSVPVLKVMADILAIMVAVALPWSTTASGALILIWVLAVMPTLHRPTWSANILSLVGGLPVLLFLLALAGTTWSDVSFADKIKAIHPYVKLLMIPPLLTQFGRSQTGHRVLIGFLASCSVLLVCSLVTAMWPSIWRPGNPGVPVKDQIAQSAEFAICAFCLLYMAIMKWRSAEYFLSAVLYAAALVFFGDVLYVATSRTELVVMVVLTILFFVKIQGWRSLPVAMSVVFVLGIAVWFSSSYVRSRISHGIWEVKQFDRSDRATSIGLRFEWWKKSLGFMMQAPIIGNGTGSTQKLFQESTVGKTGAGSIIVRNPHNQIFAVAIPLGLVGVGILIAMWTFHLLLFRENSLISWIGLVVVCQTVVGSLFNSHLFDFTHGWIYVWAIGVAGGMILGRKEAHPPTTIVDEPNRV
jgi:O-antigen ligase